jgi:Zn-dependent protease with chaperone function
LAGCAEITRPTPARPEVEAAQLAATRRHPHQTWAMERVSRVFIRLLACVPQVHGRTYPFLGFNWWVTETGKLVIDYVWRPSPAHEAGLRQGDLILAVNNWPLNPGLREWDDAIRLVHDAFSQLLLTGGPARDRRSPVLALFPGELLVSLMLDLKHIDMEARGRYITGPVELLIQREDQKFSVTLYPQHLPAEYGVLIATKDRDINAYAAPGRLILSYRLVNFCLNDDELALVIGHELAHQVQGHLVRGAGYQVLGEFLGEALIAFTTLSARHLIQWRSSRVPTNVQNVVERAVVSVYSQNDEREADAYGSWFAFQAGYDLDKAMALWERLAAVKYHDPFERTYFLTSHPAPLERMARLQKISKYFKAGRAAEIFLQTADLNRRPPPE